MSDTTFGMIGCGDIADNFGDVDELDFENPDDRHGFADQVEDTARAARGDRDPVVTGHESRHPCDAVAAMHATSERGEPVVVAEYVEAVREGGADAAW